MHGKRPRLELDTQHGKQVVGQIALAYQRWIHVLGVVLDVEDIPKIIEFVDHIFEREVALYEEYKTQFPNIYKDRCADYFTRPPKKRSYNANAYRTQPTQPSSLATQSVPLYAVGGKKGPKQGTGLMAK